MNEPQYSARKAADVVLFIALASAIVLGAAGVFYLRDGENVGWLLLLLGVLPLVLAVIVRTRLRAPED